MAELIEAGVDWLRVTTDNNRIASGLARVWSDVCSMNVEDGGILSDGGMLGYTGTKVNGQFFGSRADGTMLNLSGNVPSSVVRRVLATGAKCTRVDLQVTVRTSQYTASYAEQAVDAAFAARAEMENRNWAKIRLLKGYGEGDTAKIGSRTSGKYGRLYDKEKQSHDDRYERCWRYEVEYKDELAPLVALQLQASHDIIGFAIGMVRAQFIDWAFNEPFPSSIAVVPPRPSARASDTQKTLDWLCIQVRPSIGKLLDAGMERDTILEVLGLSWGNLQGDNPSG